MLSTLKRDKWRDIVFGAIDYAFEPIVNIHTGATFGFEALLRNFDLAGFKSIPDFFDTAYHAKELYQVELLLRERIIEKFSQSGFQQKVKLFINIDNRVIEMRDYQQGNTSQILARYNMTPSNVCFEISEQHKFSSTEESFKIMKNTRDQSYKIAIDDFGTGFSGFQLLYYSQADFIKIDRFFISNIAQDSRKRFFVSSIINMAHLLGIIVIAEGVETDREFFVCKELGCDLVQGYLIHKPTTDLSQLRLNYETVSELINKDRRKLSEDQKIVYNQTEYFPQISIDSDMESVFDMFLQNKDVNFFPVTTNDNEPLGIVRESDLKSYAFSMYGRQLLKNKSLGKTLKDFVVKCPIIDINTRAEKILEVFATEENTEGIIMIQDMQYIGFLTAKSLLKVLNEKNLVSARDQNPLTKLPGNNMIYAYLSDALNTTDNHYSLVYFDLDNFKSFNDKYGFRKGDRVILLFCEILRKAFTNDDRFIGHVGGDDFFVGFKNVNFDVAFLEITLVIQTFIEDVKSLYDIEDLVRGYISSKDRDGAIRNYPLLTVSAAMLEIVIGQERCTMEEIGKTLADIKKNAKACHGQIVAASIVGKQLSK